VKIPPGVTQGQQIRLAGQGGPGPGGGPAGDLFLEIDLAPHPFYRVDNRDVYLNLPVAPWEAALGARVTAPTLSGPVDLTIPAGSQSGRKLRLKGRGLPGHPAGDQYVVLQIVTPRADSEGARALYERMAREMRFNPRADLGV
jgi:curved DNA-binding protein